MSNRPINPDMKLATTEGEDPKQAFKTSLRANFSKNMVIDENTSIEQIDLMYIDFLERVIADLLIKND